MAESAGDVPPRKKARGDVGAVVEVPEKSPNDELEYRLVAFPNGFEALLISSDDQKKNKAAAAVAVQAGSFSDPPKKCEGLAHYLEHMLFMGSERYPEEDDMENFLSMNGGYSNAYTESAHTCYYFEVNKAQLHKGLDMLAQFFVAPLLKTDSADRELDAIDSEFRLTQNSDSSRVAQLFAHFARPGHPFRIFGWGNSESLRDAPKKKKANINKELKKFYKTHYRAPRLRLCVYGVEPLDSLEEAVLASFDNLPGVAAGEADTQDELLSKAGMPFDEATLPKLLRVRPVKDTHKISLSWQLPAVVHLYRSKPELYVQHLVGHEGSGSLLSWLKQQGIATSLTAGVSDDDFESNKMCAIFSVEITLTAKGLERWLEAVQAIFIYLDMLREVGPQEWVFDEIRLTQDMGWQYLEAQDPTDQVQELAQAMLPSYKIDRQHILKASQTTPDWDPEAVTSLLGYMTPHKMFLCILSSAYGRAKGARGGDDDDESEEEEDDDCEDEEEEEEGEEEEEEEEDGDEEEEEEEEEGSVVSNAKDPYFDLQAAGPPSKEPYFGTEFWEASNAELAKFWGLLKAEPAEGSAMAEAKQKLRLPEKNKFIATDFGVREPPQDMVLEAPLETPEALRTRYSSFPPLPSPAAQCPKRLPASAGCHAWHLQDTVFKTPRSELWLKLCTDEAPLNPRETTSYVLLSLLGRVLTDALNETAYLAEQACLELHISTQTYGLDVTTGGFSHKLPLLLEAGLRECLAFGEKSAWDTRFENEAFCARLQAQREQQLRSYRNKYMKPGEHAADLRRVLIMPHKHPAPSCAAALEAVDEQQLAKYAQELIPKLRMEVLLIGNATAAEAEALIQGLPVQLRSSPEAPLKQPPLPVARVPDGKTTIIVEDSPDSGSRVAAVEMYWQLGTEDFRGRAELDLLEAIMSEPLFDSLRTKQQLGYVASCGARCTQRVLGYSVWLLSSKVGPAEICRRVEAFLPEFRQRLLDMPAEDFERHVSSLAATKLEPDRTLLSVQEAAWGEIQDQSTVFDRYTREAIALASVTREDLLAILDRSLLPGAEGRRLLVVSVVGGKAKAQKATELEAFREAYPGCWLVSSQAEFHEGTTLIEPAS